MNRETRAPGPSILDAGRLRDARPDALRAFRKALEHAGFVSRRLNALTGKEVTRYVNISPREEDYLRRQVLHDDPRLAALVDLFLLSRPVEAALIRDLLPDAVLAHLTELGLLVPEGERLWAGACLAPLEDKYFLNDGMRHLDHGEQVLTLVLEQAYLVAVARRLHGAAPARGTGRVLDICAGSGVIGQAAAPEGWRVEGIDINPRAIAYARFNAMLNGIAENQYELMDIRHERPEGSYDLILANPPYNAYVPASASDTGLDITLHAGVFGDAVSSPILENVDGLLAESGLFCMVGIFLLKDGRLRHPACEKLSRHGTLAFLHQPISAATTWEGLRLLFNCTPEFDQLAPGAFAEMIGSQDSFNQVAWGVLVYAKDGRPGYHRIYNVATDAVLLPEDRLSALRSLICGRA